ncbi:hypothetical protein DESC_240037 [Desulfosarcina cetonica]|uniref:hypothetical protein n=1 Tax=Desulfosarcina cetonica TaxID=90730 RepID=UPI0006D2524B|nr:hypothetical protein [Desulfosarcina cetonica]VTR64646.1 hypothetical protein DESC_240037 [Desulfosarcina cetonica]
MIHVICHPPNKHEPVRQSFASAVRGLLLLFVFLGLTSGCSYLVPPAPVADPAAEALVTRLNHANAGLAQFKWVGRLSLARPNRPVQVYRAAVAGQHDDRLRIDLFSPVGGSAASFSSDGSDFYVIEHASREYHKKAVGRGSLRAFVGLDIHIKDLLEFMAGRIPVETECVAQRVPVEEEDAPLELRLVDRRGRVRQRITLDQTMRPAAVVWFDSSGKAIYTLTITSLQDIDGFTVPRQMALSDITGRRLSFRLDRFMANAPMSEDLFVLPPPP